MTEKTLDELQHHYDTTIGLFATDVEPSELMETFLHRDVSDNCPFTEDSEEEKYFMANWKAFCKKYFFQIK